MVVEQWDESFSTLDGYRGVNANMHSVEALMAAADALDDDSLRERALRIVTRVVHDLASTQLLADPRALRRHLDAGARLQRGPAGTPLPAVRRDDRPLARVVPARPAPARLAGGLRTGVAARPTPGRCSRLPSRRGGPSTARTGSSTPWTGAALPSYASGCTGWRPRPSAAAAAMHAATGDPSYAGWYETWWDHVADRFLDRVAGVLVARAVTRRTSPAATPGRGSPTSTTRCRPP